MRHVLLLIAFGLAAPATAQACQTELTESAGRLPPDLSGGVVAAELLATAVQLVEPALPPLAWSAQVPLATGEEGYDAVRYLAQRRLLPNDWQADGFTAETWHDMLSGFLAWYGLEPMATGGGATAQGLIADLAIALEQVGRSVKPLALVASSAEDENQVAFLGLVWNWTVYPRLIVRRPGEAHDLSEGVRPLLELLGSCAIEVEHYVFAPEETARRLFLSHADARMYVIGSEPELTTAWPLLVPEGSEEEYFGFAAPEIRDLVAYSAAFDGGALGVRTLMTMLPRLRTNVPPTRIPGLLRTPPPR
jgi:hypothetical protein